MVVSAPPPSHSSATARAAAISHADSSSALHRLGRHVEARLLWHDRRMRCHSAGARRGGGGGGASSGGSRGSGGGGGSALAVPVDTALVASFLTELQLDDVRPLLDVLPCDVVAGASGPARGPPREDGAATASAPLDLRDFVREIRGHASDNALLRQLASRLADSPLLLEPVSDEDVHALVHYTLMLDQVTRALARDPELAAQVYARLRLAVRSTADWWRPLGLFEVRPPAPIPPSRCRPHAAPSPASARRARALRLCTRTASPAPARPRPHLRRVGRCARTRVPRQLAKLATVERTCERFIRHRREASLPANFGHVGLPVNILEAVLQDVCTPATPHRAATTPSRHRAELPMLRAAVPPRCHAMRRYAPHRIAPHRCSVAPRRATPCDVRRRAAPARHCRAAFAPPHPTPAARVAARAHARVDVSAADAERVALGPPRSLTCAHAMGRPPRVADEARLPYECRRGPGALARTARRPVRRHRSGGGGDAL